jgi:hypothetical protein
MNIFLCHKASEAYLRKLDRQFRRPQARIRQVTQLRDSLFTASELFPALGLDSLSNYDFRTHKVSVDRKKVYECLVLLQNINLQLNALQKNKQLCKELASIQASIAAMIAKLAFVSKTGEHPIQHTALIQEQYRGNVYFLMSQATLPALGTSTGECYGLAIDYGLSRMNRKPAPFSFQHTAAEIQTEQHTKHPAKKLYLKRLGQCEYQPKLDEQAKLLADYALKHSGEHLVIKLKSETDQHLAYLQYTPPNKWHYFEPNNGAFAFTERQDFEKFYNDLYSELDNPWHSFQASKLMRKKPRNTWTGKWRSLLTGSNYQVGTWVERIYVGLTVSIILGAIAIGCLSPLLMLSAGALPAAAAMSIMMTSLILFELLASIAIYHAINHVVKSGFTGLLAVPRYFDYHFRHKREAKMPAEEVPVEESADNHKIHTLADINQRANRPHKRGAQGTLERNKVHTLADYYNPYCFLKPVQQTPNNFSNEVQEDELLHKRL